MPDSDMTPRPAEESSPTGEPSGDRGSSEGLSDESHLISGAQEPQELPPEYRPYSQFPWDEIPEGVREKTLQAVKKFHGAMSRGATEAGELRRLVPELRQKAEFLDRLSSDPGFISWYNQRYYGGGNNGQAQAPPPEQTLTQSLDKDAVSAIQQLIRQELGERIAPVHHELVQMQRLTNTEKMTRELNELRATVDKRGWPQVDQYIDEMTRLVSQGRARTVEDAYFLAAKQDMLESEVSRAVKRQRDELEGKASTTVAPFAGTPSKLTEADFSGPEATLRALQAAKRELGHR